MIIYVLEFMVILYIILYHKSPQDKSTAHFSDAYIMSEVERIELCGQEKMKLPTLII